VAEVRRSPSTAADTPAWPVAKQRAVPSFDYNAAAYVSRLKSPNVFNEENYTSNHVYVLPEKSGWLKGKPARSF